MLIQDYYDNDNSNIMQNMGNKNQSTDMQQNQINFLLNLTGKIKRNSLSLLEWDNTLSNAAEEYYKIFNSGTEDIKINMDTIISQDFKYPFTFTITYTGSPLINNVILQTLLNQANSQVLLSNEINQIGIFAAPLRKNTIFLIINLSKYTKE